MRNFYLVTKFTVSFPMNLDIPEIGRKITEQ